MIKDTYNKLFFPHDGKPKHFKALDGLRGLAVLLVLLSHSSNESIFFHRALNFHSTGKIGVYLFFVLSAYLLDRQIAQALLSKKASPRYWKYYFSRRFLRIFPLFAIALFLFKNLTFGNAEGVIEQNINIPLHLILLKGESIFWSIPVEFKYYFISPILLLFCHKFLNWNRISILAIFCILVISSIAITSHFQVSNVSTIRFLPLFLVGTFIAIIESIKENKGQKIFTSAFAPLAGIIAGVLIFLTFPYYFNKLFGSNFNFRSHLFYLPYAILWGTMLLSAKYAKGVIQKILELKILRFLGVISFSLYLFHLIFLRLVMVWEINSNVKIYLFFILSILFSSITYLLIEKPLSRIRITDSSPSS